MKERASLNVTLEAKLQLGSVKATGQSYDGVIRELVKFHKERGQDYWTRRKVERESSH